MQQQSNNMAAAGAVQYDHLSHGVPDGSMDGGDAVTSRWLQSSASPPASIGDDSLIPNLLMQGYEGRSAEEKQRILRLMRMLNFNCQPDSEPQPQISQVPGGVGTSDEYLSSEFRSNFGAGLMDLHSMDDTELLSEHVVSEPLETSSPMPAVTKALDAEFDGLESWHQRKEGDSDFQSSFLPNERDYSSRENSVAKIKVVVRKRPLNKKETVRKEEDIVSVYEDTHLTVHEPKLKVDLTAYVDKHEFCFDAVLDEQVSNDEVYRVTVEPIIPTIFQHTKATCFAYGQTGSGKTYTMKPLPLRASQDLVRLLHHPMYQNQRYKLWLSYFEIYGGKLFDLLNDRKKLCMREDGKQQVCIVGLQEFEVCDIQFVKELIELGNAARSTGSTGVNEESSRSHAILQLVVKKYNETKESRRYNDRNEPKSGKVIGKISFIDLAGNERGADTTDNDRQTRIEGAEINKSLLALKECIRALDNDRIHIPFRGSKLTEVLRDSFVGNSRTVMISCISPNAGSCEHTLNTLRYADRVKGLSKTGDPQKEQTSSAAAGVDDGYNQNREPTYFDTSKKVADKEFSSYNVSRDFQKLPTRRSINYPYNGKPESTESFGSQKDRFDAKNMFSDSRAYKRSSHQNFDTEEVKKVLPPFLAPKHSLSTDKEEETKKVSHEDNRSNKLSQNTHKEEFMWEASPHVRDYEDEVRFGGSRTYKMSTTQFSRNVHTEEMQKGHLSKMSSTQLSQNTDTEEKLFKVSPPRRRAYGDKVTFSGSSTYKMSTTQLSQNTDTVEMQKASSSYQRAYDDETVFGCGSRTYMIPNTQHSQNTGLEEMQNVSASHRRAYDDESVFGGGSRTYKMLNTRLSQNIGTEEMQNVSASQRRAYDDESVISGGSKTYNVPTTQLPRNSITEEVQKASSSHQRAYEDEIVFSGSYMTNKMPNTQLSQNTDIEAMQKVSQSHQRAYKDERVFDGGYKNNKMPNTQLSQNTHIEAMQNLSPSRQRAYEDAIMFGGGSKTCNMPTAQLPHKNDLEEMQKVLPSHGRDHDKMEDCSSKNSVSSESSTASSKQQNVRYSSNNYTRCRQHEPETMVQEHRTNEILEEVEALIAAHRKEIQDTMEIIRDERKLLAEVDQPGSEVDNYVTQLSFVMSRKAASLVTLQARVARFQHRLKEEDNLNTKRMMHY